MSLGEIRMHIVERQFRFNISSSTVVWRRQSSPRRNVFFVRLEQRARSQQASTGGACMHRFRTTFLGRSHLARVRCSRMNDALPVAALLLDAVVCLHVTVGIWQRVPSVLPLDARFVRVASRQHPSIVLWCRETARDAKDRVRRCLDDTRHSHSRPPGLSAGMSACRIRGIVKMRGTAAELGRHISASPAKTPLDGIWRRFEGIKSPRNHAQ